MLWTILILVGLAALAAIALQIAIARNGPAVLDTVDRLAGGSRATHSSQPVRFGSEAPAQKLVVHRPHALPDNARLPVVVFFHGGSWDSGDPEDYAFVGRNLVPSGMIVVTAGYRLGERGAFTAMLEDGADAVAWVRGNIVEWGGNPDAIMLMGHSAGAYNAAMLALDPQWLAGAGVPRETIRAVVGLAGPYDFYPFDSASTKAAFGAANDPEATQPVNVARRDAPPFLLIHGTQDTTVRQRNSQALQRVLRANGTPAELQLHPEMDHTAPLLHLAHPWRTGGLGGEGGALHEAIVQFLAKHEPSVPVQSERR